jgi:glycosyltransferase involved in cell wall biosynthesis
MSQCGHDVTVYCRSRNEGRRTWRTEDVRCIHTPGIDTKSASTLTFGATSVLDAAFRGYDAALVLNVANGFWLPVLRAARLPFVVNTDGLEWERGKWSPAGKAVFRTGAKLTARFASELVCDSRAIGAIWAAKFNRTSTFIPYGAPVITAASDDRIRQVGLGRRPYVLVVARLAPENNVDLTLDAVEAMGPSAPFLVVVGSANFESPTAVRLKAMQAKGKLAWLGHVADQELLTQLWAHSTVYVHGHSVGGTNPALLQALGAGAPTLALDTAFNAEVLPFRDQLFPPDARALARAITRAVESPALREVMARRGQHRVKTGYTWESVCTQYTETLESLTHKSQQGPRLRKHWKAV